jgi:hypothetical protein
MGTNRISESPTLGQPNEEELTEAVHQLILESAPERRADLEGLWKTYSPTFAPGVDQKGFKMQAGAWGLIVLTFRTTLQIWILGFAAWRAFKAYCPYGLLCREITPSLMSTDVGLLNAEKSLSDGLLKSRELRNIENLQGFNWPSGIPAPGSRLPTTIEERAVVDLIKIAAWFAFLHEVRHALLVQDCTHANPLDEEYECDRHARDFLLEKVSDYCAGTREDTEAVLSKRLMGIMLGAFVILEMTPEDKRHGSDSHPGFAQRLQRLIGAGDWRVRDHVWIYASSLMLGVLRREQKLPPYITFRTPQDLFEKLVPLL